MQKIMRELLLLGIGAAALTQERLEALVNEWVDTGDISREEGKTLIREYVNGSKRRVERVKGSVGSLPGLSSLQRTKPEYATKGEVVALERRLKRVERRLRELEKAIDAQEPPAGDE